MSTKRGWPGVVEKGSQSTLNVSDCAKKLCAFLRYFPVVTFCRATFSIELLARKANSGREETQSGREVVGGGGKDDDDCCCCFLRCCDVRDVPGRPVQTTFPLEGLPLL